MRLVLFQPDIPQNAGTMLRLAAAMGVPVDLIEPCGFVLDDRRLRRSLMDYADLLECTRWSGWAAYAAAAPAGRLVLATTRAALPYAGHPSAPAFAPDDRILVGRESGGVPQAVHDAAALRVAIPMVAGARALNVAVAAAMILGEALRQTGLLPHPTHAAPRTEKVP